MTYAVRFTLEAAADLDRLYDFILQRDATDFTLAEAALQAIRNGFATLRTFTVYMFAKHNPMRPSLGS